MFNNNKYTKKYYTIINKALQRTELNGYVERHHIIPKSLQGSNDSTNIVILTAREHFICHLLLIKMVEGIYKSKMAYAAWQLSRPTRNKNLKITNKIYENLKRELSISYTGRKRKPFTNEAKKNMSESHKNNPNCLGHKHTKESKELMSKNRKGLTTGKSNPFYGKTHSKETIELIALKSSLKQKGISKPKSACQYCGMMCAVNTMKMYHGESCKSKPLADKVCPSGQF